MLGSKVGRKAGKFRIPTSFVQSLALAGHREGWHECPGLSEELKFPMAVSDRIDTQQTDGLSLSPAAWHL